MISNRVLARVFRAVESTNRGFQKTGISVAVPDRDPYRTLIACLLSLRTKDEVTDVAAARLFTLAETPQKMLALPEAAIAKTVYPVGFYRTKAATIHAVSRDIIERFRGQVPDTIDALLTLKGVGRKTANLVVTLGYGRPGICVDTHVHRVTNRWGYVKTRAPDETESALRKTLPRRYWIPINDLLVQFGRNVCQPVSPRCSICPLATLCPRIGVKHPR
ncbi:MAG: endonuclease III [Deltaproteobacteria bacterium]|nr:endonuclease III [Deltaproteobacteria bacterium]